MASSDEACIELEELERIAHEHFLFLANEVTQTENTSALQILQRCTELTNPGAQRFDVEHMEITRQFQPSD